MAEKTQGTILRVETSRAATKAITGITAADPPVVSSTAHGYANGGIVYIANVGGMIQVNDRAFVVANQASGTFELKGIKAAGYTAYTSLGDSYLVTLVPVAEVTNITVGGGGTQQIDITNLLSQSVEQLPGLPNLGTLSFDVTLNHSDAGQAAFRALVGAATPKTITITTIGGFVLCATGYASNFNATLPLQEAQRSTFEFTIYRTPAWFA